MIRTRNAIGAVALTAAAICQASDAYVSIMKWGPDGSTEGIASFSATVTYTYMGGTTASVDVLLLNDTAPALGGYITGLALNSPDGVTGLAFVSCTSAAFVGLAGPISASPYGKFDAGASLNGSWEGSGNPTGGIAVGESETFSFTMSGSASLLGTLTGDTVFDNVGHGMAVRFRGGEGGWSDKVLGRPMPAPGVASLLLMAGIGGARRRRR